MKDILKTMPKNIEIKYDEKFTSESNADIIRKLIPWLITSLKPRFNPSFKQVKGWLCSLHKHHCARLLYSRRRVLGKDNKRIHKNNRMSEVNSFFLLF